MDISGEFLQELCNLQGLECWGVVAGEGTGSRVTLDFGAKIERARPLRNPRLPEVLRQHKGAFGLFIQNCAWRLDADKVICSWKAPNDNEGAMVSGLNTLIGQHVVTATARVPAYDLVLEFSGSTKLHLFCDCFDQGRDGNNYSFHSANQSFAVGADGVLTLESRRRT